MTFNHSSSIALSFLISSIIFSAGCGSGTSNVAGVGTLNGVADSGCSCPAGSPAGAVCYCCPAANALTITPAPGYEINISGYVIGSDGSKLLATYPSSPGVAPTGPNYQFAATLGGGIQQQTWAISCYYNTGVQIQSPAISSKNCQFSPLYGTQLLSSWRCNPGNSFAQCAAVCTQ